MINDVKDDEDKEKKEITSSYHWRDVSVSVSSRNEVRIVLRNDRLERKSIWNVIETSAGVHRPMD